VTKMLPPLHRKGYSPYIIEDTAHGYRLMVGAFYTEAGAAQQVAELAKDGFSGRLWRVKLSFPRMSHVTV